jgi:hypothetical protein
MVRDFTLSQLDPETLTGDAKETYLRNLEQSLRKLSRTLGSAAGVDATLANYVGKLAVTAQLLQYRQGEADVRNNTGIYKEVDIDLRSGFPTMDKIILFSNDVSKARERLTALGTTKEVGQEASDVLFNWDASEESRTKLIELEDRLREINFYNRVLTHDFVDVSEGLGSHTTVIDLLSEDKEHEHFSMFYAGWDMAKLFFSAYSMLLDDDRVKYLFTERPGHIFKTPGSSNWEISPEVNEILLAKFGTHPAQYFTSLERLEGIDPIRISYIALDAFETTHANKTFTPVLQSQPDAAVLVGTLITSECPQGQQFDHAKNTKAKLYIVCSDSIKASVMDYYTHNQTVEFDIVPF